MAGKAGRAGAIAEGTVDRPRDVGIAKKRFLEAFASRTVAAAMATVGRSEETYKEWRRTDESFRAQADAVREARMLGDARRPLPDFETFCQEYLHQPLEWHQLQWVDVLEGREPRDLHYSQAWNPGYSNRVLINVPPEHGKSTTLTMNWVTYQIVKNPNIRIILVSKNQKMAKQFLWGIKSRLTGPRFRALQAAFGPTDGFAKTADQWSADQIYLGEKDDGEKDPTIQALGMGGQIYGARADIVLVDDAVLLSNAHDYEQQARWLTQEVLTRLGREGVLAVVGTRVAPTDLYKHLVAEFPGVWSHLASPAILEDNEDPALIKTLWPERWDMAAEPPVRVPQWDGPSMVRRRQEVPASTWSLAYMQADVVEDAIFPEPAVLSCLNRQRMAGIMVPGAPGHRREGMVGLYVVCSMDPALSGSTATVAYGVDAATGKRWVLDLHNEAGMTPASIRQHIYAWTEKYQPREWRIEKNAMQGMLTQDEELRAHLSGRGCRLIEHFTSSSKWDSDYGVASMAPLFLAGLDAEGKANGKGLIDIPYNRTNRSTAFADQLVHQLVSWRPKDPGVRARPGTTDMVMALWFADIRAQELMAGRRSRASHLPNQFLSRAAKAGRVVVNLDDWMAQSLVDSRTAV